VAYASGSTSSPLIGSVDDAAAFRGGGLGFTSQGPRRRPARRPYLPAFCSLERKRGEKWDFARL